MTQRVLIVGAGVAGLTCGRTLHRAGLDVTVLEASDGVGGRIRTDTRPDGFRLDRGFQVLFTAYPAAKRQLDYDKLNLRIYDPGAVICVQAGRHVLGDPVRDPSALFETATTTVVSLRDKLLTGKLSATLALKAVDQIMHESDETTENFVRRFGFSERYVDRFLRPFFGSVFQNDDLQTSAKAFQFDWKMLVEGQTVVPALGIGAISDQLAEELRGAGKIRLNTPVVSLSRRSDRTVNGVCLGSGERIDADTVVVATPAPEAARLTERDDLPRGQNGTTSIYFAGDAPVTYSKKILLHGNRGAFLRTVAPVSNVAPEQAPTGKHLICATAVGIPDGDDETLIARTRHDLRRMLAGDTAALTALETYTPLAVYRIPYGQFPQPPGVYPTLPTNRAGEGVVFAAEFTAASSSNAAIRSGEKAAAFVLAPGTL